MLAGKSQDLSKRAVIAKKHLSLKEAIWYNELQSSLSSWSVHASKQLTQGNFAEVGVNALNSWRLEFDGSLNLPEEKSDTKPGFWNTPKVW